MTKREAKRDACRLAVLLIENYFDVGQPETECADANPAHPAGAATCQECTVRRAALTALRDELDRRSDGWVAVSWRRWVG